MFLPEFCCSTICITIYTTHLLQLSKGHHQTVVYNSQAPGKTPSNTHSASRFVSLRSCRCCRRNPVLEPLLNTTHFPGPAASTLLGPGKISHDFRPKPNEEVDEEPAEPWPPPLEVFQVNNLDGSLIHSYHG